MYTISEELNKKNVGVKGVLKEKLDSMSHGICLQEIEPSIVITMEEYKELLAIKGKYEILKQVYLD